MTYLRKYQLTVVASLLLYVAWNVAPLISGPLPMEYNEAFEWSMYGGQHWVSDGRLALVEVLLKVVVSFGLLLLLSWARWLMLALAAFNAFMIFIPGLQFGFPIENLIGYLLSLSEGAILALVFLSPIAQLMRRDQ
jgi:hypothetical protein